MTKINKRYGITGMLLMLTLLSIAWVGTLVHAQTSGAPTENANPGATTGTSVSEVDSEGKPANDMSSSKKAKRLKKNKQKKRTKQSQDHPQGDPEAPQNQVEYRGP